MQRNDDHSQLLSKFDGLPTLLSSLGVEEAHYDSIIVDYQHLEQLSAILHHSMDQFSKTGVKIVNVTESKPFKHKKSFKLLLLMILMMVKTSQSFFISQIDYQKN